MSFPKGPGWFRGPPGWHTVTGVHDGAGDTCWHGLTCILPHVSTGGQNMSVRGCGSPDLCSAQAATEGLLVLPGHRLARRPQCSTSQRAVMSSRCHSGAPPGLHLALSMLLVALSTAALC